MGELPKYISSRKLSLATDVAKVFMLHRSARRLNVENVLAGMYVAHFDSIAKYWKSVTEFEMLAEDCGVIEPRWVYQQEYYHLMTKRRSPILNRVVLYDDSLQATLDQALEIRKRLEKAEEGPALITVEHVLLAIPLIRQHTLSKRILRSGLNLRSLRASLRDINLGNRKKEDMNPAIS